MCIFLVVLSMVDLATVTLSINSLLLVSFILVDFGIVAVVLASKNDQVCIFYTQKQRRGRSQKVYCRYHIAVCQTV
ncbi:hypothetical protein ES288_A04G165600v1 [Gossypium darwinii]|uniref:Uncharacterized protein n=1 Tax=Gossypium darwinii TaxID=34276 RepID=A0A5D2GYT7_GOSDA|nr:hypothetical protein ES288_A04G165600v1 [Gossypium darwinii]